MKNKGRCTKAQSHRAINSVLCQSTDDLLWITTALTLNKQRPASCTHPSV